MIQKSNLFQVDRSACVAFLFVVLVVAPVAFCQQADPATVLAKVGESQLTRGQVLRLLIRSMENLPNFKKEASFSEAQIQVGLRQCIEREIVLQYLDTTKYATGQSEINIQLEAFKGKLKQTEETIEGWLTKAGITQAELIREIKWRNSWRKFVAATLTEARLREQFEAKREQYDGTRRHVAQILWKSVDEKSLDVARDVHVSLKQGTVAWKDAVASHSQAASAKNEGDLSWIGFDGPMPRKFTDVVFALRVGEFAEPFTSQFGTHIVWCKDVQPGKKTFEEVTDRLRLDETTLLLQSLAEKHRDSVEVTLIGAAVPETAPSARK